MIARLRGEVIEVGGGRAIIEVSGVGYEVLAAESLLHQLVVGSESIVYIRYIVREDGHYLFGFENPQQKALFGLLTDVKGCGPKTALALLSELGESGIAQGITTQDVKMISRAQGVGPRLAERIIVDLKDKISEYNLNAKVAAVQPIGGLGVGPTASELVDALLALGYRRQEAEVAALEAEREADGVEDQLKIALRRLAK